MSCECERVDRGGLSFFGILSPDNEIESPSSPSCHFLCIAQTAPVPSELGRKGMRRDAKEGIFKSSLSDRRIEYLYLEVILFLVMLEHLHC